MLADGSEYRGDYDPGAAALREFHRPRIEALVEAGADLLAFETIPTVREAEVLVGLLDDVATPAWLSFSCRDGDRRRPGSRSRPPSLSASIRGSSRSASTAPPRGISRPSWPRPETATDLPLIAYPNGGERWDAASRRWVADDGGGYDPPSSPSWAGLGATWLGGCCGTGPADIAALAERVQAA